MEQDTKNPSNSPLLRVFFVVEIVVLVIVGGGLFFLPEQAAPYWPWTVPLFNSVFLGTVYLSALATILVMFIAGRWAPARVGLWMLFGYTSLVLLMSLAHLSRFFFQRPATWLWFFLFIASPLVAGYELWRARGRAPAETTPTSDGWRIFLLAQGALLAGYFAMLLVAPVLASGFWPWPVDEFHGRMYSAIFLTGAIGSFLIARVAARVEFVLVGMTELVLGLFALLGVVSANSVKHTVQWTSSGVLLWLAIFAALLLAGASLIWHGLGGLSGFDGRR